MKIRSQTLLVITLLALLYANMNLLYTSDSAAGDGHESPPTDWETLNLDGDVSLSRVEDVKYWNSHIFGFTDGVEWGVYFTDEVQVTLKTSKGESGHVATGMWWTAGFKEGKKIPIYNREIQVEFDVKVEKFIYEGTDEWLRIALACAVQRKDGSVVYTEIDILDSPNTQRHPTGNIPFGGDIIYRYGDVVEFKLDEIPLNTWRHYSVDLDNYLKRAWGIEEGDLLESVYIVVESDWNPVEVELKIDNFWINISS